MREFFRGWRRKIGVVALVMACVFMAGWVRSHSSDDSLSQNDKSGLNTVYSRCGRLEFERFIPGFGDRAPGGLGISIHSYSACGQVPSDITADSEMSWRWACAGFHIGQGQYKEIFKHRTFIIPYWFIVLPLTALSAFLILPKPRPSNQKKTPEPFPERLT